MISWLVLTKCSDPNIDIWRCKTAKNIEKFPCHRWNSIMLDYNECSDINTFIKIIVFNVTYLLKVLCTLWITHLLIASSSDSIFILLVGCQWELIVKNSDLIGMNETIHLLSSTEIILLVLHYLMLDSHNFLFLLELKITFLCELLMEAFLHIFSLCVVSHANSWLSRFLKSPCDLGLILRNLVPMIWIRSVLALICEILELVISFQVGHFNIIWLVWNPIILLHVFILRDIRKDRFLDLTIFIFVIIFVNLTFCNLFFSEFKLASIILNTTLRVQLSMIDTLVVLDGSRVCQLRNLVTHI